MKDCNQCGKCCIRYADGGLSVTADEVEQWAISNPSLLRFVSDGNIWIDPNTAEPLTHCPWLEVDIPRSKPQAAVKYRCRIYHDRPDDCRHYPVSISDMLRDGCEMIELCDLHQPKKAQVALDHLMADSRPPRQ